MNKYLYGLIAFVSIGAGSVGFQLIKQANKSPSPEHALYYPQARSIADFTLIDEAGQAFNNQQLLDKWSLVFFGYTSCPDVCPTTLQNLQFIYDDLTNIADNSQVLLVTVDPKRDTSEKLNQYINYFNPKFKALRGEHDVLFPFSRNLGMMYAITPKEEASVGGDSESYWVDHSASLVLINPAGKVAAIFKPEQTLGELPSINNEKLLSDYQKIVALY